MSVYYNEWDPYAAQWLRNLISAGYLADGEVDERSITEVKADDLRLFRQCHFFAGIGGWALAARIAGWSDDRGLWTGSPPCQPFSVAGRGMGEKDQRHLWPELFRLISARRPDVFMGEQVAAAVGKGWIDGVFADMEGIQYACAAAVIPACAVNAPHRRDRIWYVADANGVRRKQGGLPAARNQTPQSQWPSDWPGDGCEVAGWDGKRRRVEPSIRLLADAVPSRVGRLRAYGNAISPRLAAEVIAAYMDCRP